jgi:hypothetical protein
MPRVTRTPIERFMAKVEPEPNTGCHLWTAYLNRGGYGQLKVGKRMVKAHRFAYEAFVGPIPDGLCVLHHCDTPACVNPEHLFLGTQQDNIRDMGAKGRNGAVPGERNGNATLTAEDVRSIRARWAAGERQAAIGREFGVNRQAIWKIVHRAKWRHVTWAAAPQSAGAAVVSAGLTGWRSSRARARRSGCRHPSPAGSR